MFLQKNYNTYLVSKLLNTSTWEIQVDLNDTPESDTWFIILEKGIAWKDESLFYHRKSWNSVFCYWVNRSNPVQHEINSSVLLVNSIDALNYIIDNIQEDFFIYKKSKTDIIVTGWDIYDQEELLTLSEIDSSDWDPDHTFVVNKLNYVYIDRTWIYITDTNDWTKYIIWKIYIDWIWDITSIVQNKPRSLRWIRWIQWIPGQDWLMTSIQSWTNNTVDASDPANPIINSIDTVYDDTAIQWEVDANTSKLSTIETNAKDDQIASEVPYDNWVSWLLATNVKWAIDEMISKFNAVVILKGEWDASVWTFPASTIAWWSYVVSTAWTVDWVVFNINDRLMSISDSASTTVYTANWIKLDYTDNVLSVNSQVGSVVLDADDISDTSTAKKFLTLLGQSITWIKTFLSFPLTPSSAPTTDYQVANKKYVDDELLWIYESEYDAWTSWTTKTIDWANGMNQKLSMTWNCTFTLSNPIVWKTYILKLTQDATWTRTGTFPATIKTQWWTTITLSTAASSVDILTLYWDWTNYNTNIWLNFS